MEGEQRLLLSESPAEQGYFLSVESMPNLGSLLAMAFAAWPIV
jgi:hypothetical protein